MAFKYVRLFVDNTIITKDGYALHRLSKFVSTPGLEYTLMGTGLGQTPYYVCSGIGTNTNADIVIADAVDGVLVTEIYGKAFESKDIVSVYIPDSVVSIGVNAFYRCTHLVSVTIPDSVTSISNYAFNSCSSLTSIVIPDGVTSIAPGVFYGCISLTSIIIPDGVTSIGSEAFYHCDSLTSIVIPDGVTSIGNAAFFSCDNLASVVIPNSVTSIGQQAFDYCDSLSSIEFRGTMAQWNAITKGTQWYPTTGIHIKCTDGTI